MNGLTCLGVTRSDATIKEMLDEFPYMDGRLWYTVDHHLRPQVEAVLNIVELSRYDHADIVMLRAWCNTRVCLLMYRDEMFDRRLGSIRYREEVYTEGSLNITARFFIASDLKCPTRLVH